MPDQTHELFDFLKQASEYIQAEYTRIRKRSGEDAGTAGDEGEENWKELLEHWLPPQFRVETKGKIIFSNGTVSPQLDVIVLSPEYPRGFSNKKLFFAGGVLAAFECKLTLRSKHIAEIFRDAAAVTRNSKQRIGTPYRELHRPIILVYWRIRTSGPKGTRDLSKMWTVL